MNKTAISWAEQTWTWRLVEGHPGYMVNADGKVRGPSGKVLRPSQKASGHAFVTTGPRGHRRNLMVHQAVLTAFAGPCPVGMEGRHLNGHPGDNRASNLRWGTRVEQREDDRRNGVIRRPNDLVLDDTKARAIRDAQGHASSRSVGRAYGISHTTVQKIWRGERWKATR